MNTTAQTLPDTTTPNTLHGAKLMLRTALGLAVDAIYQLADAGSTVTALDIRGGMPVLRIDQPPQFVRGSVTVRRTVGRHIEKLYAAPFRGCQLEWLERSLCQPATAQP